MQKIEKEEGTKEKVMRNLYFLIFCLDKMLTKGND